MVADVRIVGLQNLDRVARELKASGNGELKKELLRGIREGAKPLQKAVKQSAETSLPHSGGLAALVAKSRISISTRLGANPSVRLTVPKKYQSKQLNEGKVRHPVFPHGADRKKWKWVEQKVTPGWFDKPVALHEDDVRKAVGDAIQRTINKIK